MTVPMPAVETPSRRQPFDESRNEKAMGPTPQQHFDVPVRTVVRGGLT
jgi:hypothetical protein